MPHYGSPPQIDGATAVQPSWEHFGEGESAGARYGRVYTVTVPRAPEATQSRACAQARYAQRANYARIWSMGEY